MFEWMKAGVSAIKSTIYIKFGFNNYSINSRLRDVAVYPYLRISTDLSSKKVFSESKMINNYYSVKSTFVLPFSSRP